MKAILTFFLLPTIFMAASAQTLTAKIEKVASFKGQQVIGVTISDEGRIFTNFPRWRNTVENSVVK